MNNDLYWMSKALVLARKAESLGEVPVGAVLVFEDRLIGEGFNQPIFSKDPSAHAEIVALRAGAKALNNYRLVNTTLYVTLEPCLMCTGAMIHARIQRLVFGAFDPKKGDERLNHHMLVEGGVMALECATLLQDFFKARRKN